MKKRSESILRFLKDWMPFGGASTLAWLAYLNSTDMLSENLPAILFVALFSFLLAGSGGWWFWKRSQNAAELEDVARLQNLVGDRLTRPEERFSHLVERVEKAFLKKSEKIERERKENRVLLEAIADAVVAFNSNREAVFFNTPFEVLFPFEKREGVKPSLQEVFSVDPDLFRRFDAVCSSGGTERLLFRREISEEVRYFNLLISPLRRDEAEVYGALGVFHDITELKKAEQIRIDFVSNVSHELRTPLTAIKGYADTLSEDLETAERGELRTFVTTISRNADRLMALVNDLLDLSSLESGADLRVTRVDLRDFTVKALEPFQEQARERQIEVEVRVETPKGYFDESRMEQVLTNLVENALKYIPENRTIQISWTQNPDDGRLVLEVRDNGSGISKEHLPRLFERFYRVDKGRTRQFGGTGLGLAIVKHIIQRHGGSVYAESTLGKGTSFVCQIPQRGAPLGSDV